MLRATREQVLGYRAAAQALHRPRTVRACDLAVLDIGVQDSGADGARLVFAARLPDPAAAADAAIGPGEDLALAWSLRVAPYVHRRADLDAFAALAWPLSEADAVSRLDSAASVRKVGRTCLEAFAITVDALRTCVTVPTGKGAASASVSATVPDWLQRDCRACRTRHVYETPFRSGALPAGLELEPDTAPPVLVPRADGGPVPATDPDAVRALARAYLTMLGPAGPAEVAGYLGARRADVADLWPDDLVEVEVDGRRGWLPEDRVTALRRARPPEYVRLLGPFDPWLQARDRHLIVPDATVHKTLWPVLGRPGVLLAAGEVVGVWRPKSAGSRLTLTVQGFVPLPPSVWAEVEAEAERMAVVRRASRVAVVRKD